MDNKKLYVDMVPYKAWYSNLRNELAEGEWDKIRKSVYKKTNYCCEICNAKSERLEAHERWKFDVNTKTQTLVNIEGLCSACHEVTHIGLASVRGNTNRAITHMMKVNRTTKDECAREIVESVNRVYKLNNYQWNKLDLTYLLDNYNSYLSNETKEKIQKLKEGKIERNFYNKER